MLDQVGPRHFLIDLLEVDSPAAAVAAARRWEVNTQHSWYSYQGFFEPFMMDHTAACAPTAMFTGDGFKPCCSSGFSQIRYKNMQSCEGDNSYWTWAPDHYRAKFPHSKCPPASPVAHNPVGSSVHRRLPRQRGRGKWMKKANGGGPSSAVDSDAKPHKELVMQTADCTVGDVFQNVTSLPHLGPELTTNNLTGCAGMSTTTHDGHAPFAKSCGTVSKQESIPQDDSNHGARNTMLCTHSGESTSVACVPSDPKINAAPTASMHTALRHADTTQDMVAHSTGHTSGAITALMCIKTSAQRSSTRADPEKQPWKPTLRLDKPTQRRQWKSKTVIAIEAAARSNVTEQDSAPNSPEASSGHIQETPDENLEEESYKVTTHPSPALQCTGSGTISPSQLLRDPGMRVTSGQLINLQTVSFLTETQLNNIFCAVSDRASFRWFAGRSILDFKVDGGKTLTLEPPYDLLNPLIKVMVAIAANSLDGEDMSLLQLIVNYFQNGDNEVKPHRHRCRQVCVSLGATRTLEVEGQTLQMRNGDALPLRGEMHRVPRQKSCTAPRTSVCLFYGSLKEYMEHSISVNAVDGWFGESYWWHHPQDTKSSGGERNAGGGKGKGRMPGKGMTKKRQAL